MHCERPGDLTWSESSHIVTNDRGKRRISTTSWYSSHLPHLGGDYNRLQYRQAADDKDRIIQQLNSGTDPRITLG